MKANPGKRLVVNVDGQAYARIPVKTRVITVDDDIMEVLNAYVGDRVYDDDIVFISEKAVAITQGRAFPIKEIVPSPLANMLSRFVYKSPHGIGLGSPWTMELAIREAGAARVILSALLAAVGKLFGIKGVFYRVCGKGVAAIDGPCSYTLPPYNEWAVLGPVDPQSVAQNLSASLGCAVAIIDANDLGIEIMANSSDDMDNETISKILKDNPLGQSKERTPIGIIRRVRNVRVQTHRPVAARAWMRPAGHSADAPAY